MQPIQLARTIIAANFSCNVVVSHPSILVDCIACTASPHNLQNHVRAIAKQCRTVYRAAGQKVDVTITTIKDGIMVAITHIG